MALSWLIDQDVYILNLESTFDKSAQYELYVYYIVWFTVFIVSNLLVWVSLKPISSQIRYDFFVWFSLAFLLALFYLTNRGYNWCFLSLIGIPLIGFNYILNGFRKTHFSRLKIINRSIFILWFLIGAIGEFGAYEWSSFENEEFQINCSCYTIPTFLDWQVECDIYIENKLTDTSCSTNVSFGNGPHFSLFKDLKSDTLVFLSEPYFCEFDRIVFDMKNEIVLEDEFLKRDSTQIELLYMN